jgi:hypothetical protein
MQNRIIDFTKYLNLVILFGFVLIILTNCTKEIEIDLPNQESVPVLNCIFITGEPFKIDLTKSGTIFTNSFEKIESATILIYENEILVDSLFYIEGFYYSNFLPQENNTYKLTAKLPDGTILESENKIPAKTQIHALSITDSVMIEDDYYLSLAEISIERNCSHLQYYEIVMFGRYLDNNFLDNSISTKLRRVNFSAENNFDPVLLESGLLAYNTSSLMFTNQLLLDNESTIKILFNSGIHVSPITASPHIEDYIIVLRTVNEDYFRYKKQIAIYEYNPGSTFESGNSALDEPVFLHSNIKGGKGIFAGFTYDSDTIPNNLAQ